MSETDVPAKPGDNLKAMTVRVRGESSAGKSQLMIAVARFVESLGMTTRIDADGHNLAIVSGKLDRCRLYALNRAAAALPAPDDGAPE